LEEVYTLGTHYPTTVESIARVMKPVSKRFTTSDLMFFDAFKKDPLKQDPESAIAFAGAPMAMHRKITGGLDPMDQLILNMHTAGKSDSEIRAAVCEQFSTMYTVKSLSARYKRIVTKCSLENAKALAQGKKEWTSEMVCLPSSFDCNVDF
jgi:hypothetical protein